MARALHRLTARQAATLTDAGRHSDGDGLYLRITPKGARSWVFISIVGKVRKEHGLGALSAVPLARARQLAAEMREKAATGGDPRSVIEAASETTLDAVPATPTFGAFAETYIASVEAGWRNPIHRQQWRSTLRDHAAALSDKPVDAITTEDVLAALQPIWTTKAETAQRLRGRIEKVLDAAKARKLRPADLSCCRFRGHRDKVFLEPEDGDATTEVQP